MIFALHRVNRPMLRFLLLTWLLADLSSQTVWADEPPLPLTVWQSAPDQAPVPRKPWVLRERAIALNPQSMQTLKDAAARPHPPVSVELFDGARYELDIVSTVSRINDSAVIRGAAQEHPSRGFYLLCKRKRDGSHHPRWQSPLQDRTCVQRPPSPAGTESRKTPPRLVSILNSACRDRPFAVPQFVQHGSNPLDSRPFDETDR